MGLAGEVGLDHAESFLELGEIPARAAEDLDGGAGKGEGVELAGDGLEQGGFAAAVGTEDGNVFAGLDEEVDVAEDRGLAAGYVDVLEVKDGGWHGR